jgi:predicted RNase H-like HicB family nuclease
MYRTCPVASLPATQLPVENEIREAIRFHIDGRRADGIAIPEPTSIAEYVET